MKPNPHPVPSSVRKKFFDSFDRQNTENDLGTAPDGSLWDSVRGIFKIFNNRAESSSPASEYPIASVNMPFEDVSISLKDIDNGAGAALWVTDNNNWFAVGIDQEPVNCNCSVGTDCNRWNAPNCSSFNSRNCREEGCIAWNANNCTLFNQSTCSTWNAGSCRRFIPQCVRWVRGLGFSRCVEYTSVCAEWVKNCRTYNSRNCRSWSGQNCSQTGCVRWNSSNCSAFNARTCNQWFEFTFDCETCYPQWVRFIQSVGSTVSTLFKVAISKTFRTETSPQGGLQLFVQDNPNDPTAKSIKVSTIGSDIKVEAFENADLTGKIDIGEEILYTPTNVSITPSYGIIVTPSTYNQRNYIGEINIDKTN